jgi:UDP-N-acetylglucosamine:LPS N-acetylglucosamine transferase
MAPKKILFVSGSLGLGHVIRDLVIAKELRKHHPDIDISWIAADPASMVLKEVGEKLLPEAAAWANENDLAESISKGGKLNLVQYVMAAEDAWKRNAGIFYKVMSSSKYDLAIGDEAYELAIALREKKIQIEPTFVMMYDFIGVDAMTEAQQEAQAAYFVNERWAHGYDKVPESLITLLFVGEEADIPDRTFGPNLPKRRDHVRDRYHSIGYIVPFEPDNLSNKKKIRNKLGYGDEPLITCSIGGTAVGKPLLDLCAQAFPIIKEKIPAIRMVLVGGPRVSPDSLKAPQGVEIKGYVPELYEHFAASDLAIVVAGGTTTIELTALRRPFLYFPLEEDCEHQIDIAHRLARHKAGLKMSFSETTPQALAEIAIANLGKEVTYLPIATDGAKNAVAIINKLL